MKKIYLITLLSICSFFALSQDIDQAFLDSLPNEVREDVLNKIEEKKEQDKPIYRKASTMIDKDDEVLQKAKKSKRFGSKIFDQLQTSFMPINEPNFDGSYILDFGDVVEIQYVGQDDSIFEETIDRDGSINLSGIGKVYVSGLPLNEATNLIKNKVSSSYIGTQAFVSLLSIRDIQILITGNAFNPGVYTLNGNSNILQAITMAGGIDESGSFRSISIVRNDKLIKTIDLYETFIFGKQDILYRLRSGDSILINPVNSLVNIDSGVNRPGTYELHSDETLMKAIEYANGLSSVVDTSYIAIERLNKGQILFERIDSLDQLNNILAKDGDSIFLKEFKYNVVEILGAVEIPGRYILNTGETLSDIIKRAGGYTYNAYPFGGYLNNQKTLEINKIAKESLYNQFIENILINSKASNFESLPLILNELKNIKVSGRVMAEFNLDIVSENPSSDTVLDNGDEIFVPYNTQQVYVFGEVNSQGTVRYSPEKDYRYYIESSGGVKRSGDDKNLYLVQPNGQAISLNRKSLSFLEKKDIVIYPGSILYVPRKVNVSATETAAIWAPILSSLALSLTSLSVLDNN